MIRIEELVPGKLYAVTRRTSSPLVMHLSRTGLHGWRKLRSTTIIELVAVPGDVVMYCGSESFNGSQGNTIYFFLDSAGKMFYVPRNKSDVLEDNVTKLFDCASDPLGVKILRRLTGHTTPPP